MRAAFIATLVTSWAVAQQPAIKASLEGRVVDSSGKPLERVQLTLVPEGASKLTLRSTGGRSPDATSQSDANGEFRFSVEPGRYLLLGNKAGLAPAAYGGKANVTDGTILDLGPGQEPNAITFRMFPTATISGHVRDQNGKPLSGVDVAAERIGGGGGGPKTDLDGAFTIPDLTPGQYRLRLRPSGRVASGRNGAQEEYVTTYYPSSPDDAEPKLIELEGGDKLGFELALPNRPVVRVSVRGTVRSGALAARVLITEQDGYHFQTVSSVRPASDGSFVFDGVAPGHYKLVSDASNNISAIKGWIEIEVGDRDLENVLLSPEPSRDLTAHVVLDGQNVAGVTVTLEPPGFANAWRSGVTGTNGTVVLTGVLHGKYRLSVSSIPPSTYVASAQVGGSEVSAEGFNFTNSPLDGPFEITLARPAAEISGTVRGPQGSSIPGAIVTLVPEPARRGQPYLYRRIAADQTGQFHLKDLAPGNYRIAAWTELGRDAELAPDFQGASAVAVGENSSQTISLPLMQGVAH